jgi:predicted RNA-binding Zn-ribbon protein involved in translation (DUF1610 family)
MKRTGYAFSSRGRKYGRSGFEKTTHNPCPSCGSSELTVYFRSGSPQKVGAYCHSCGLVGFFAQNHFFELERITHDLIPPQTTSRMYGG